ncbi:hypothetical protein Tco_1316692 [Tanacetum coccineum]
MTTLQFVDTHNLVAFLSKPAESEGFEQIVDFLNANPIRYALTINPTIYTSCIEQFWATVKVKPVNGEAQLQALVDGKKIIFTEASVRCDLQLNDEEGTDCLPNATIFEELTRMGYEKLSQKLTFYKAFFSPQWKFLIHTILQCLSAKTTAWNNNMVKNLDNAGKFLMYLRKMKRVGKGFSGRDTPLFPTMMVQAQQEQGEGSEMPTDSHHTPTIIQPSISQPQLKQRSRRTKRKETKELVLVVVPCAKKPWGTQLLNLESSEDEGLGEEDASKQGRIADIDADAGINLVSTHFDADTDMFRVQDLVGDEVVVESEVVVKVASTIPVSVATTTTTVITNDEITLAKALAELKTPTPTVSLQQPSQLNVQDKANIVSWDNVQAMIDVDYQMAQQMQEKEQEKLSIEEKSKLFIQLLEARKKHFAAIRAKEKRNKLPTKAQKRNAMSTYLKNMAGYKDNQLKNKSFDDIQKLFNKVMKRVNTFVDMDTELVEGSKQKVDENKETAELQRLIEVVPDKEEVAIDAIHLATKPPSIVDYKIHKEGKKTYYQIIRANGSSKMYLFFSHMLKSFDREDLETLWKLLTMKKLEILKKNIKFRGGLLGLKDFLMILELLLLSTARVKLVLLVKIEENILFLDVSTGSPSSTSVDQDAPSPSASQTPQASPSHVIPPSAEEVDHDIKVAHMDNNPQFVNQPPDHINKWTKDHLIDNIEAMQEELNKFERLKVWDLVPRLERVMIITLKWIYKVKLDERHQGLGMICSHHFYSPRSSLKESLILHCSSGEKAKTSYCRPNLQFVVFLCAQYQEKPTKKHLHAVKRIFRYLRGTINMGLWYSKDSCIALTAFTDADHAGCQDTRRSTSRSMQLLGDRLLADIFTKALGRERLDFLINKLGMRKTQQVIARDEKWVPSTERVKIIPTNVRLETTVHQKEETFQVIIDVIKNSTCFKALTIFEEVPAIFMQQFWYTIKKVKDSESYEFLLANKKCIVNAEVFRKILDICPRVEGEEFTEVQDGDATLTFITDLGYKGPLHKYTSMENVNYPKLIWEDFAFQIDHMKKKSRCKTMPFPRFTKVIINQFLSQHKSLSNLKFQHYHIIKDDGIVSRLKRVVKKKVPIYAADKIIPDLDVALELGKSISLTEAVKEEAARQIHATHARIMTEPVLEPARRRPSCISFSDTPRVSRKVSSDPSQTLKGVQSLTPEEQEVADTMQALKKARKSAEDGQENITSEANVILEWGSEQESEYSKEDQRDDDETIKWVDTDEEEEKKDDDDDDKVENVSCHVGDKIREALSEEGLRFVIVRKVMTIEIIK